MIAYTNELADKYADVILQKVKLNKKNISVILKKFIDEFTENIIFQLSLCKNYPKKGTFK